MVFQTTPGALRIEGVKTPKQNVSHIGRPLLLYPGVALLLVALNLPIVALLWVIFVVPEMRENW